jgi:hypothetical protein
MAPPGEATRTETSVPGPAPPVMSSDPSVPVLVPKRSGRAWTAVAIGVVVGLLATWMAARHSPAQRVVLVPPPVAAPAAVTPVKSAGTTPPAPAAPSVAPAASRPAPHHPTELPMPETPEHEAAAKPGSGGKTVAAPAIDKPARRAAPPRRVVKKKPAKKPPPGWDPESILPP